MSFNELSAGPPGRISSEMRAEVVVARAHDKILAGLARTIAYWELSEPIEPHHIEEASNYRRLDRDIFH